MHVLAAGERVLLQCLHINPSGIEARTTLMYNLAAQNRQGGRICVKSCSDGT